MPSNTSTTSGVPPAGDGGQEKQKMLLSSETGHFSMIRALHLADLVTELNGFCGGKHKFSPSFEPDDPELTAHTQ
ncbi:hypothetical protein CBS147343_1890 [Aspergillus niger]|nr:hypothetical protein CBS12448_3597 [Aspergillus niger]KAI2924192.1 hypothetical protein CBS147371_1323 [Aspergillus niger]KAI2942461.1 hypothetical protein CBS147321_5342 [Aspergillus niger]KAI3000080.1 hypothetical protein CBS147346_7273 [Aspergillus niger]KAI3016663.1 hypothetical protein CBS147482_3067 [Aspergillus niger]